MYNTQQNEVEMVTAGEEDPIPIWVEKERASLLSLPSPNPAPGFFGMPPTTLPELDLPFPHPPQRP